MQLLLVNLFLVIRYSFCFSLSWTIFSRTFRRKVDDATPVYIGIIIFGAMMTAVVVLLLRLDWVRITWKFAPWTLDENNEEET